MRQGALLIAAGVAWGCAHQSVVPEPAGATSPRAGGACTFRHLSWNAWTALSLPQTGQPFGTLYGSKAGPVRFDGAFRKRAGAVVLEGTWSNPAFELSVFADASRQPVVYARGPLRQGRWFVAAPEARLNVAGLTPRGLEVTPERELLRRLHPTSPLTFQLTCAELTLAQPPVVLAKAGSPRRYPAVAEGEGLTAQTPEVPLKAPGPVALTDTPGGATVATVDFTASDRVAVAERQPGYARIGFEIRHHVFIFGWVRDDVVGPVGAPSTPRGLLSILGSSSDTLESGPSAPKPLELRCPEPLDLHVGLDGARHRVGRVLPGARLDVLGPAYDGMLPVALGEVNLSTGSGVALLVPDTAATCLPSPPPL